MPKSIGGSRKTATSRRNTSKPYKPSTAKQMQEAHNKQGRKTK